MIPEGDPHRTTYLNEIIKTNQPEQQNNTFWFPTLKNFGKTEDQTPMQTRMLRELRELKEKEKLNPKDDVKSRRNFQEWLDWADTLIIETEKQAVEDILVEYYEIFARHRLDIVMNTEFKVKLAPKDDKVVYCQNLPMPIQLWENIIVE